jgi:hypothetical protein
LLSPIIYSTLKIIKSIRRDWRGTIEPNGILSSLYARLGRCYYHRMQDSKLPLLRDEAEQISVLADIESLRLHDKKSTTLGVGSIQWIHRTIVHQRRSGNVEFGRLYLSVVLDYLFPLVNNTMDTMDTNEAGVDTQDVLRYKHTMAQSHLLDILNSDFRSELVVFQDTRHKFSEFLSTARQKSQRSLRLVELVVFRGIGGKIDMSPEPVSPVVCHKKTFGYIVEQVHWMLDGNVSLLKKLTRPFDDFLKGEEQVRIMQEARMQTKQKKTQPTGTDTDK